MLLPYSSVSGRLGFFRELVLYLATWAGWRSRHLARSVKKPYLYILSAVLSEDAQLARKSKYLPMDYVGSRDDLIAICA